MQNILKGSALAFLIIAVGISLALWLPENKSGEKEKEQALAKVILSELNENHYAPKELNDAFSKQVFSAFISAIDYEKQLLTAVAINKLTAFETQIDDNLQSGTYTFFDEALILLEKGIKNARHAYEAVIKEGIDFSLNETWETDPKKRSFVENDQALQGRWRQIVSSEVIKNLWALESENGETKDRKALEEQALQMAKVTFDHYFDRLDKQTRMDRLSKFFNAMLSVYGPHNSYLTPRDQEEFDIEISRSLQGVGVVLAQDDPYIKIDEVIAGGPVWKSKQIDVGDIVLKITESDGTMVELTGKTPDEAVNYFRGEKGTVVTLTIQKSNNEIKQVPITRDVIILEAGIARSLVVEDTRVGEKVGYIQLPRFYFSRDDQGRRCSEDVQAEIEKLQKSGVDGLIIDLRNNRGGSLQQTLRMAGLFIEAGPILQREAKDHSVQSFDDKDSSVLYSGELIVLVNAFSGSASEVFSATLQDYGRAVIVGSNSTFGKGTIQNIRDLDQPALVDSTLFPLGTLKMTVAKFFRVTGASTQLKGVEPDIVLPDLNSLIPTGEKAQLNPLPWTEIRAIPFQQNVNTNPNLEMVKKRSAERLQQSTDFAQVMEQAKQLKELRDHSTIPLNYQAFTMMKKEAIAAEERLPVSAAIDYMEVHNIAQDVAYLQADPARKARNEEWVESVKKDIYIDECLFIMHDLNN